MLEDLLMQSLPDNVKEYTSGVVRKAKTEGVASFSEAHLSKAVIRTYMAWQDPPDTQYLGVAISKGMFKNIAEECRDFLQWLERLFEAPTPPPAE